ncbi:hypothetical protein [Phocaeicola oris]|uniref:hypothetical protein n=1 Tax=Phocaeicola oris TaxID=2896850 RepID=UPI00234EB58F|nr:hypothetical protein [Phocaeicola oris]MCE2617666.1 hypothetical protein [Phocaeicola oris]
MKTYLITLLSVFLFVACKNNNEVERVKDVEFSVVTKGLMTRLPGYMHYQGDYIKWEDPMCTENIVHIMNPSTGEEISAFGKIGDGPEDFPTPDVNLLYNNDILVSDLNEPKECVMHLDSLHKGKIVATTFSQSKNNLYRERTKFVSVEKNTNIHFCPRLQHPFVIESEEGMDSVGNHCIDLDIDNRYDVFQGNMVYNDKRKILAYSAHKTPYICLYKYSNHQLTKLLEQKEKAEYNITDHQLKFKKGAKRGDSDLALSENYIIRLFHDIPVEGKDPTSSNPKYRPRSLYICDYDLNPVKIINFDFPLLRIAACAKDDMIYAVAVNPEFDIIKIDLNKICK